ncbi:hypothetical protein DOTSEDRAFT_71638 [Dothistroma septosporum NZE10]|uniref:Vacuolar sorting protein Vps3844 C-terminal domain-containing protein n=1 Tax=Dothistroma septosporum (strain NZE10 / CBS 128990) TaxID=675120 RepID=N1PK58_DOTSN|nr:hypothetical protein DOTSEDRAFT_71638 [Dothistroma septosporum NZE10]
MKINISTIIPALCCTAQLVAASSAHVYIHDPHSQPSTESRTLEPVAARLVLAQRAGVEDYHDADLLRQEVVKAINDYGLRTHLFEADSTVKRAMFLLEGESDPAATSSLLRTYTTFELDPAPAAPASRGLFVDLAKQSMPDRYSHHSDEALYIELQSVQRQSTDGAWFHVVGSMAELESLLETMTKDETWSITILVIPPGEQTAASQGKYQWGTYSMPNTQAPLEKRQRKISEEPLTESFEPVASSKTEFAAPISINANNTSPLRGILPACFSTQSACESATRNCTGHGSCSKRYHDSTANNKGGIDCFSCSCKATKSSDGKKTTYWGGPACQKKDISIQFWLIVLFTVGMIFLVGFAVGTIMDMGSQELPSVIGAGVSGPSARK